jgi:succinate dehydrogenase / fumarate reductase flavoprotein subunit
MYHQFKALGDIDITAEPMEVGPTTHYMMGGVRVDGDSQMSTVPGLFAAGECAAGLHGANRLGGNSLSDLLVFGQRAGHHAALFASQARDPVVDAAHVEDAARTALLPFERTAAAASEGPFAIAHALQDSMQDLVGIVRVEADMRRALDVIAELRTRAGRVAVYGNREYNPGWHTALDLRNLLTVSQAITLSAIERKESRGAHFRDDYPARDAEWGRYNLIVRKSAAGEMEVRRDAIPEMRPDLRQIIEEIK